MNNPNGNLKRNILATALALAAIPLSGCETLDALVTFHKEALSGSNQYPEISNYLTQSASSLSTPPIASQTNQGNFLYTKDVNDCVQLIALSAPHPGGNGHIPVPGQIGIANKCSFKINFLRCEQNCTNEFDSINDIPPHHTPNPRASGMVGSDRFSWNGGKVRYIACRDTTNNYHHFFPRLENGVASCRAYK